MNTDIFRKYDIRGIADDDLTSEVAQAIGMAYAAMLLRSPSLPAQVAVGIDARASGQRLFDALTNGLRAAGVNVLSLGMIPTPLAYFSIFAREDVGGAIMITGSHNPAEYNGFKMMLGKETLHGEHIQELRQIIESEDYLISTQTGLLSAWPEVIPAYKRWVTAHVTAGERKLRVVLDSGNGVAGLVAPALVREAFGAQVIELFSEPDASFPNHHPDPTVEDNLTHLIDAVKAHNADLGVAYDGDGDRIGVVDEQGQIIWGDRLMILLSRDVLKANPGATIIGEVKCSQTLFDDIAAHGGQPVMAAVGHSLIKAKIKETGAKLAGEMSGHIFFNDRFFGFDDATYATCRLVEIISAQDRALSELMSDVPKTYATPELRQDCDESIKFQIPSLVADAFSDRYEVNTIDGVRVNFGDGWGLVRASNTQPVLVLRTEATSAEARDAHLKSLTDAIAQAQASLLKR